MPKVLDFGIFLTAGKFFTVSGGALCIPDPPPASSTLFYPCSTEIARMQVHGREQGGGGVGRGGENGSAAVLPEAAALGQPDDSCHAQGEGGLRMLCGGEACVKVTFRGGLARDAVD